MKSTLATDQSAAPTGLPAGVELDNLAQSATLASELLRAMANPTRLMILCQLAEGEKSVGEIQEGIEISQSALSQHLAVLRRYDVVRSRRVAQSVRYSLASAAATGVMEVLYREFCTPAKAADASKAA